MTWSFKNVLKYDHFSTVSSGFVGNSFDLEPYDVIVLNLHNNTPG